MSRDVMERLVLLPLSGGCICQDGVAVLDQRCARGASSVRKGRSPRTQGNEELGSQALLDESMKTSAPGRFMPFPKSDMSRGFQRLLKNIKIKSQLIGYKDEIDSDTEMHIGLPTNVKHVTHIGWDRPEASRSHEWWLGSSSSSSQDTPSLS